MAEQLMVKGGGGIMADYIDIVKIRSEALKGTLHFYINKNLIMCTDTQSCETVVVGEIKQEGAE